uniref:diguanylate cyclase n=1 Tax=Fundidesulfovibrio putealis TaxID=270496 RepID=A0A7C4AH83_9BACT
MMQFDFATVALVGLVLNIALAVVMLLTYLTRKTYPGFLSWTASLVFWTLANSAFFARQSIGETLSVLIANPAFMLFGVLVFDGMARFYGFDTRRRVLPLLLLGTALCTAGVYWNLFVVNNPNMRVFWYSCGMWLTMGAAGAGPMLLPDARRRVTQLGISMTLLIQALFFSLRAADVLHDPPVPDYVSMGGYLRVIVVFGLFMIILNVTGFITLVQQRLEEELLRIQEQLRLQADTDPLTGAANRRSFTRKALEHVQLCRRYGNPLSLIIFDLDHFKVINDTYGHMAGDEVLAAVAGACRGTVRATDVLGRWGGEEFAVLMPETGLDGARRMAERLRGVVAGLTFRAGDGVRLTASFGVAELGGGDFDDLVRRADERLYQAKRAGRDTVRPAG